jgi:hypothetical protein
MLQNLSAELQLLIIAELHPVEIAHLQQVSITPHVAHSTRSTEIFRALDLSTLP